MIKKIILLSTLLLPVSAMDVCASAEGKKGGGEGHTTATFVLPTELSRKNPMYVQAIGTFLERLPFKGDGYLNEQCGFLAPIGKFVVFPRGRFDADQDLIAFARDGGDCLQCVIKNINGESPEDRMKRFKLECFEYIIRVLWRYGELRK